MPRRRWPRDRGGAAERRLLRSDKSMDEEAMLDPTRSGALKKWGRFSIRTNVYVSVYADGEARK